LTAFVKYCAEVTTAWAQHPASLLIYLVCTDRLTTVIIIQWSTDNYTSTT